MDDILNLMMKQINKTDCDKLYDKLVKEKDLKLTYFLEAMYLYNMYYDSLEDKNALNYLYPYKLKRLIEVANTYYKSDTPYFSFDLMHYKFNGKIMLEDLSSILSVFIKYRDIKMIKACFSKALPYLEKVNLDINFYIGLKILDSEEEIYKIGQYLKEDYYHLIEETNLYPLAFNTLKEIKIYNTLPLKARASYFELKKINDLYNSDIIFDYGAISLLCFKIIEICIKDFLKELNYKLDGKFYDFMPSSFKENYNALKFSTDYLELGKIYYLFQELKNLNNDLSNLIMEYFIEEKYLDNFISYIDPKLIKKYRNSAAHSEYIPYELSLESYQILIDFILHALYYLRRDPLKIEALDLQRFYFHL